MILDDCRSISGGRVFMNGAPTSFCSAMEKFVTLSVTEADIVAGIMVVQDMMYMYRLMKSLKLKVELPMVLEIDNSRAANVANSWSVGGRMCHVDVHNYFLWELKDQGLMVIRHIRRDSNEVDIFMKNTRMRSVAINRHMPLYAPVHD